MRLADPARAGGSTGGLGGLGSAPVARGHDPTPTVLVVEPPMRDGDASVVSDPPPSTPLPMVG